MKKLMPNSHDNFPHLTPVGDSALLIELGDGLDPGLNARIHALDARLTTSAIPGVTELVPAYASLLVHYDPLQINLSDLTRWVQHHMKKPLSEARLNSKRVEIPVHYGGSDGPDLDFVAELHRLTPSEVVEQHASHIYRVGMMGFTPGFAYLLGLPAALETPRRATPRTAVPAGSVGIAGTQTGIYPLNSPGGWQLIGRTDKALYDPTQAPYFLLSPGDEVRFIPVGKGGGG